MYRDEAQRRLLSYNDCEVSESCNSCKYCNWDDEEYCNYEVGAEEK